MGPVWDFDRSWSPRWAGRQSPNWHGAGDGHSQLHLVGSPFKDANFWQKYIDRGFARAAFSTASLNATIDSMANEIREAQAHNYQKWPGQGPRFGSFQGEIDHLNSGCKRDAVGRSSSTPPQILPAGGHIAPAVS
jgi:hypothetical protein